MNKNLYRCYSPNLKTFLYNNNVHYDLVCKDIKTDKTCWVYIMSDKLSNLLIKWSEGKSNK